MEYFAFIRADFRLIFRVDAKDGDLGAEDDCAEEKGTLLLQEEAPVRLADRDDIQERCKRDLVPMGRIRQTTRSTVSTWTRLET